MNIRIISSAFSSKKNKTMNVFIYQQAKDLANRGHKVFVVGGVPAKIVSNQSKRDRDSELTR